MNTHHDALIAATVAQLLDGLRQDQDMLHAVESMHGDASPRAIARILSQRDSSDAATLAALLLFPGADVRERIEPLALAARCSPQEARDVGQAVERAVSSAAILLPGGGRLMLALEPGDAAAFVERLQLADSPPEGLTRTLDERFSPVESAPLSVMLRTSRLRWTPGREAVVSRLLAGLGGKAAEYSGAWPQENPASALLAWTLSWLDCLGPDALWQEAGLEASGGDAASRAGGGRGTGDRPGGEARPAATGDAKQGRAWPLPELLGAKHLELTTRLRRAVDFQRAFARSSFEVMMSQGVRAPLMHPEAIREELALLDGVSRILAGCPAWTLSALTEVDLGTVDLESDGGGEAMMEALGGGRVPPKPGAS